MLFFLYTTLARSLTCFHSLSLSLSLSFSLSLSLSLSPLGPQSVAAVAVEKPASLESPASTNKTTDNIDELHTS